jgi:hypothetical protein
MHGQERMTVMMDEDLVKKLQANQLALETKIAWFVDLVPQAKYTSGDITWLLVTMRDYNIIGGLVDWGRGYLPFDHVDLKDFLDGVGPMQGCVPEQDPEFVTQWPVSAYLTADISSRTVV